MRYLILLFCINLYANNFENIKNIMNNGYYIYDSFYCEEEDLRSINVEIYEQRRSNFFHYTITEQDINDKLIESNSNACGNKATIKETNESIFYCKKSNLFIKSYNKNFKYTDREFQTTLQFDSVYYIDTDNMCKGIDYIEPDIKIIRKYKTQIDGETYYSYNRIHKYQRDNCIYLYNYKKISKSGKIDFGKKIALCGNYKLIF